MTKDEALKLALEYMNERLEDHDSKFMRHPATEAERDIILANIKEVKEALAQTSTQCEKQPAPPPPECKTEAEQTAYAFGWWKALETVRTKQPAQEPVAIHQFRIPYSYCADWYDGIPDHHDGHGPYEVRTLYTNPQQRPWVGLTFAEICECENDSLLKFARAIEVALRSKNTFPLTSGGKPIERIDVDSRTIEVWPAQPAQEPHEISTDELIYMTGVHDGKVLEREACAKLVDHILKEGGGTYGDAIKARGNT